MKIEAAKPTLDTNGKIKTKSAEGLPLVNENKDKDIKLMGLKINPELELSLSLTFKKLKNLVKTKRSKLYAAFREANG